MLGSNECELKVIDNLMQSKSLINKGTKNCEEMFWVLGNFQILGLLDFLILTAAKLANFSYY